MKARLLVSKMNFSASNLWLCPQTVCVGGGAPFTLYMPEIIYYNTFAADSNKGS